MRVLVTGATGFIGRALAQALLRRGDTVTALTRDVDSARRALPRECRVVEWRPGTPGAWMEEAAFVDGIVNLAGASVFGRWTPAFRARIEQSRVEGTKGLVDAIRLAGASKARKAARPRVLVNASATGFYGSSSASELDEESPQGRDFLAEVCGRWEAAAEEAEALGTRVVRLRIGIVLGKGGGAVARMLSPLGLFVLGPIGKGDNEISWVHLDDAVGMCLWALDRDEVTGAVNCTSPYPTTGKALAQSLASVLDRRAIGLPRALAAPLFGELLDVVAGSARVVPRRAIAGGYEFHHARLMPALEAAVG